MPHPAVRRIAGQRPKKRRRHGWCVREAAGRLACHRSRCGGSGIDSATARSPLAGEGRDRPPGAAQTLDLVIVTGKRKQKPLDAAGSVDALDGRDLETRGAQNQEDIFKLASGVQFNQGQSNQALPTIRGNSDLLGTQQATTGFYVEDVAFCDLFGFVCNADIARFDLRRVEVQRGPQGVRRADKSVREAVVAVGEHRALGRLRAQVGSVWLMSDRPAAAGSRQEPTGAPPAASICGRGPGLDRCADHDGVHGEFGRRGSRRRAPAGHDALAVDPARRATPSSARHHRWGAPGRDPQPRRAESLSHRRRERGERLFAVRPSRGLHARPLGVERQRRQRGSIRAASAAHPC